MAKSETFLPENASLQDWRNAFGLLQTQIKDLERSVGRPGEVEHIKGRLDRFDAAFSDFLHAYEKDTKEINEKLETLSDVVMRQLGLQEGQSEDAE